MSENFSTPTQVPSSKGRIPKRTTPLFFTALLALSLYGPGSAHAEVVTLAMETQALELATGTVVESGPGTVLTEPGGDVRIAYHADRAGGRRRQPGLFR